MFGRIIKLMSNCCELESCQDAGLKITAGHRTMTGQKCLLTGHFFTSPVILTGHICMPSDRLYALNRFFSSAYLLKSCQRKTVYFMASTQFHCKYVKLRTTKTLFVLVTSWASKTWNNKSDASKQIRYYLFHC